MTSQTLINNSLPRFSTAPVAASSPTLESASNISLEKPRSLPYQANHQVELLHLQAETEALLQEIQTAKLQRSTL